jgi:Holliday junction resolvase RusA-like endonuclease
VTDPAEVRINLSWPVSTNELFVEVAGRRRRVKTAKYGRWRNDAGWQLKGQHPPSFTGPVSITVELCSPTGRSYDLDNRLKSVLDLLKEHGVIPDDSDRYVRRVEAVAVHDGAPCTVIVRAA